VKEIQMRDRLFHRLATAALAVASIALSLSVAGCGPDLGECDMTALGGSAGANAPAPYAGQLLVQQSCASGRCHTAGAKDDGRVGAPAELNFDVVPASTDVTETTKVKDGAAVVQDRREDMWALIENGEMPPAPPAGSKLNAAQKETMRNWLACGAPVANTPAVGGSDPWSQVYTGLGTACSGCHSPTPQISTPWMATDACSSYMAVVRGNAIATAACAGRQLVVPGNPDQSVLLQKLEGGPNLCGGLMPPSETTPYAQKDATQMARVEALRDWIAAGAVKPPECP
jgi:hypothetical protein